MKIVTKSLAKPVGRFKGIFGERLQTSFVRAFKSKEMISMTRDTSSIFKGAAAGIITGGLTFMAVKSFSGNRRLRRKTAAKAVKVIGSFMDSL